MLRQFRLFSLAQFLILLACPLPGLCDDTPPFEVQTARRQLFLDDSGIGKLDNLRPTMHRPVKRGAVIRSPDPMRTLQTRTATVSTDIAWLNKDHHWPGLDSGAKRNAVKRSGFERPFQARQARLGMAS